MIGAIRKALACFIYGHDVASWVNNEHGADGNCDRCGRTVRARACN